MSALVLAAATSPLPLIVLGVLLFAVGAVGVVAAITWPDPPTPVVERPRFATWDEPVEDLFDFPEAA